ncbi:MAG: hemolysin family protein [Lachnospiraceae bacterium]|nr:hemolysin family protein [Lachnospiraceae bacterium]
MDPDSITRLIIIIILIILSAFFSSSETALTTVNRVTLKTLADDGNRRARTALRVLEKYGKMLSTILVGNNIVNLSASALATTFAMSINIPVGIATGVLTVTVLIFAEIVPKNLSAAKAEKFALSIAGIISFLMIVMTPLIFVIDLIARGIMFILRINPNASKPITENELRTYVDVSHEDGEIEAEEKEMIINVFDFGDAEAKDIMIPRVDMVTISKDATLDEVMDLFKKHMYTRLPVYEDEKDNIIGLINIKDFILKSVEEPDDFNVEKLLRKPFFTLEHKMTSDLLQEMRASHDNMAFVLNEYGSCVGMVTLEDLLEEIVGEIRDEYDEDEENLIQKMEEDTYLIEGSVKLDDINNELGTELSSEDYDSIGGLVIERLEDTLPEDGTTVTLEDGIILQVSGVSQNRIQKVIMTLPGAKEDNSL